MKPAAVSRTLVWILAVLSCRILHADPEVRVYPPQVHLSAAARSQRLLILATDAEGFTQDVAATAQVQPVPDQQVITVDGITILGQTPGETRVNVTVGDQQLQVAVTVGELGQSPPPVGFHRDVMPVLTRSGCNTGMCHGSSGGQDKFRLSLFGFDPEGDYYRITREQTVRRINLAIPEESLLLLKATGTVPHTGAQRIKPESDQYETLRRWIAEGALNQDAEQAVVERIELFPPEAVLSADQAELPLLVIAHYADGSQRDVTHLAVFISRDDTVASVEEGGILRGHGRGESFITARFEKHTVGMPTMVLPRDDGFQPSTDEQGNEIDRLITAKLNKLHLSAAPICSDEEFLRRVSIDLCGLLPDLQQRERFLADTRPDKRQLLVDELLSRDEFLDWWAQTLADVLLVRETLVLSDKASTRYFEWLRESVKQEVPFDELVTELLTVSGTTFEEPAAGFYVAERDKLKIAENVAQAFLGIRMQCAQCHNHPFDRWTMEDYYGFAAFFAHVGHKAGEDYRDVAVFTGGGQTKHPITGQDVVPKFLGGPQPDLTGRDRREVVAEWITHDNPYFAVTAANRLWAHFFGRGIVEPVDDIRISNPPVNGPLYEALGQKLVEYDFDIRRLAREIVNSQAYQRSSDAGDLSPDEADVLANNFGRARFRRISATALLDCLCQVTEAPSQFQGVPNGSHAVEIADQGSDYFLTTFGRAQRTSVCACGSTTEPTLSQALHLLNGATVHGKIKQGKVIARMIEQSKTAGEILNWIYLRSLGRMPTDEESKQLLTAIEASESEQTALEDVFWAVLNSREFVFNH